MKIKKIMAYFVTVISVVFLIHYSYNYIYMQFRDSDIGAKEDLRSQIMDNSSYNPSVLISEKSNYESYGTGYVISKSTVVTNKHVVMMHKNAPDKILVRVGHKGIDETVNFKEFEVEKVILPEDETLDVGILKLKANSQGKMIGDIVEPVKIGDVSKIKEGDNLNVIGYPGDKPYGTLWLSFGSIKMKQENFISFDAITAPGNSGSPIYNDQGEVIAMVNAGEKNVSYGFLIDEKLKKYLESIMQ